MAYPHLLALIDAKIARLKLARELLSSPELVLPELYTDPPSHEDSMHDEQPAFADAANGHALMPADAQNAAVVPAAMPASAAQIIQRVRGFQRRERRSMRRPAAVEPSALRSTRPDGPVFVPAARVHAAPAAAVLDETMPKPLDAAALARRWLSNSN